MHVDHPMRRPFTDDAALRALLEGRLEPDEAAEVREAVAARPAARRRLRALREELRGRSHARPAAPSRWWLPPPGLTGGHPAPRLGSPLTTVLAGRLRPGDRFIIPVSGLARPEAVQVVVLLAGPERWEVVAPSHPDERVTLSQLRAGPDGAWWVELSAAPQPGRQRWAVAFPSVDLQVDWSLDELQRWEPLRLLLAEGSVPVIGWEIDVAE